MSNYFCDTNSTFCGKDFHFERLHSLLSSSIDVELFGMVSVYKKGEQVFDCESTTTSAQYQLPFPRTVAMVIRWGRVSVST